MQRVQQDLCAPYGTAGSVSRCAGVQCRPVLAGQPWERAVPVVCVTGQNFAREKQERGVGAALRQALQESGRNAVQMSNVKHHSQFVRATTRTPQTDRVCRSLAFIFPRVPPLHEADL